MNEETYAAEGYILIRAERAYWNTDLIRGAKLAKLTKNKPSAIPRDHIAVKVRIEVPVAAFENLYEARMSLSTHEAWTLAAEATP